MVTASVSEVRPGPPCVATQTTSNVLRLATSASPTTTVVSGESSGQVTRRNSAQPDAPSILAASTGSHGIDCNPTTNSSVLTPICCQVMAMISTTVFSGA